MLSPASDCWRRTTEPPLWHSPPRPRCLVNEVVALGEGRGEAGGLGDRGEVVVMSWSGAAMPGGKSAAGNMSLTSDTLDKSPNGGQGEA
jgi:hypothetical protein